MKRIEQSLRVGHGLAKGSQEGWLLNCLPELHRFGRGLPVLVGRPGPGLRDAEGRPGLGQHQRLHIRVRRLVAELLRLTGERARFLERSCKLTWTFATDARLGAAVQLSLQPCLGDPHAGHS